MEARVGLQRKGVSPRTSLGVAAVVATMLVTAVMAVQDRSFGTDLTASAELLPVFPSPVGDQLVGGRLAHYWRN